MNDKYMIAYCAGLFEGEGTIVKLGNNKGGGSRWAASISMTDYEPIELIYKITGVGKIYGPYGYENDDKRNRKHHKRYWKWNIHSKKDFIKFYNMIYKFMSPRRKQKFDEAIEGLKSVVSRK